MPVILPTPDEIARMDWREREKAMQRARRTLAALREAEAQLDERLDRLWDDAAEGWAESVLQEARRLHAQMPDDPNASQHRAAVLFVS